MVEPDGTSVTAAELLDRAQRGAQTLHRLGVGPGMYVGIDTAALPWSEVAGAYFSVVWLGAVAVLSLDEVTERIALRNANMSLLISAAGRQPPEGIRPLTPAELIAADRFTGPPAASSQDPLDLVFTSGTTGEPKLVASTHAQWTGSVRPELLRGRSRRVVAHSGVWIGLSGGLHGIMINHVARGVTSICTTSTPELLAACRSREVHELHLPPHAARALTRLMEPDETWAKSIRIIRTVGGPLPAAVGTDLAARFPNARVVSFYGLTEAGSALVMRVVDRSSQDSLGRPAPGTQVRVLDSEGRELPRGEMGELAIRATGTKAFAYFRGAREESGGAPDGQSEQDGWVRTGDIGYLDDAGEVRLVGRAGELVFLRAGRVSPEAVEEILAKRIPKTIEFTVAGMPTHGTWDRIAVLLSGAQDSPEIDDARRRLTEMTGPFRPHLVRVVPTIPRGPLGKPLRRQLVQALPTDD
jgi:acyl-coenzyme A synthetase/AMP-(fatty) acid ligase